MRTLIGAGLVLVGTSLAGCSASLSETGLDFPGSQAGWSDVLSAQERAYSCQQYNEIIVNFAGVLGGLAGQVKSESEAAPTTMAAALGRYLGQPGDGTEALQKYDRERARADAFVGAAKSKGCAVAAAEAKLDEAKSKLQELRTRKG